jgi:hypothetical protein
MVPLTNILVYGLGDALNPCNLSTMVMFTAMLGWLRRRHLPYLSLGWTFIILSYIASLIFSTGGLMNILYSILFFKVGRIIYFAIGIVFIIIGVIYLIDWVRMKRGSLSKASRVLSDDGKGKLFSNVLGKIGVVSSAVLLNALATIWPSNAIISFYANYFDVPGEKKATIIMLCIYNLMLIVPFVAAMLWIPWNSSSGWMTKAPAKAKMVLSSFLLGLGIGLVYNFH